MHTSTQIKFQSFSHMSSQVSKIFIIFTSTSSLRIVFHQSIKMDIHVWLYYRKFYTEMVILQSNILIKCLNQHKS